MPKEDVDGEYKPLHDKLTKWFLQGKVKKDLFDKAHGVIWLLHEQEMVKAELWKDYADRETKKKRSEIISEVLAVLKTADVDDLIEQVRKA